MLYRNQQKKHSINQTRLGESDLWGGGEDRQYVQRPLDKNTIGKACQRLEGFLDRKNINARHSHGPSIPRSSITERGEI